MPGLNADTSSRNDFLSYKGYDLLEITNSNGIYNYLMNYGMGARVGDDNSNGLGSSINYNNVAPGDIVVYTSAADGGGTRHHTALITSVGSGASTTMVYAHNTAAGDVPLTYYVDGSYNVGYFIVHVTVQANACPPYLDENSQGAWVEILKYALNSAEATEHFSESSPKTWTYPLDVNDNSYASSNNNTVYAVEDYQQWAGIGPSTHVGDETWSALGFCESFTVVRADWTGDTSMTNCPASLGLNNTTTSDWTMAAQMRLNQAYFYGLFANSPDGFQPFLFIDGQYGTDTDNAVTDYQYARGIVGGNGGLGNRTWSGLGMCYT